MTRRDIFLKTLRGEPTDRVPVFDFLSSKKLFVHTNKREPIGYSTEDIMECTIKLGLDAAFIPFGGFVANNYKCNSTVALQDNQYLDEWGTVFQSSEYSWPGDAPVIFPVATRDDLAKFTVPDPFLEERLDGIKKAIEMNKDYGCAILGGINGPFTTALLAMGLENMSYALYDDPALLYEIMERANSYILPACERMIEAGVDGIFIAEDLGNSSSTFFKVDDMKKHVLPYVKKPVEHIKKLDSYALLHSCGNITDIFPDIINLGVDAINPIQQSAGMDLQFIKENYGNSVCLIGNVDSTHLLVSGSIDDVKKATIACLKTGSKGGRFVLSSDSDVRDEMPLENILTMFETAQAFSPINTGNLREPTEKQD